MKQVIGFVYALVIFQQICALPDIIKIGKFNNINMKENGENRMWGGDAIFR